MYCRPPATGPPPPSLKKGSILASAPPPLSSTTPVRIADDADAERAPPRPPRAPTTAQTWARKSSAAGSDSSRTSSPRCPYQPTAEAETSAAGRGSAASRPATRLRVPCSRDAISRRLVSSSQRWATSSPARWITPSRPASAASGGGRGLGIPGDGLDAERGVRLPGVAREHGHLVAALAQPLHQPRADPARGSRHRHPHPAVPSLDVIAEHTGAAAAGIGQSWTARNSPVSLWA